MEVRIGRWRTGGSFSRGLALWSAINTANSSKLDLPYDHWMNPLETPDRFSLGSSLRKPNGSPVSSSFDVLDGFARYYQIVACTRRHSPVTLLIDQLSECIGQARVLGTEAFWKIACPGVALATESGLFLRSYLPSENDVPTSRLRILLWIPCKFVDDGCIDLQLVLHFVSNIEYFIVYLISLLISILWK